MKLWLRYVALCILFYCIAQHTVLAQELAVHVEHSQTLAVDVEHLQVDIDSQSSVARRWATPIMVDHVGADSVVSIPQFEVGLERAIQSVAARSGYTITDAGVASVTTGGATGRITFVFTDSQGLTAVGAPKTALATTKTWYYLDSGIIAGVVVYLDRFWFVGEASDCGVHTLVHELVHSLGARGHTDDRHDVMYTNQTHCRYALSAGDLAHLGVSVPLDKACYTEIMRDGSVYIPSVKQKTAWLRPEGDNVWRLEHLGDSAETRCNTVEVGDDLYLVINDLRGQDITYRYAELKFIGEDKWKLVYGE